MRRRRPPEHSNGDSLELLLDTVANLFGCVMLIAMLMALMIGHQTHDVTQAEGEEAYEVLATRAESTRLERELSLLESAAADLESLIRVARENPARSLADLSEAVQTKVEAEKQTLESELARRGQLKGAVDLTQTINDEIQLFEKEIERLSEQLARLRSTRSPEMSLGAEERTSMRWISVLVSGSNYYHAEHPNRELNRDDLDWTLSGGVDTELGAQYEVSPKVGRGWSIPENLEHTTQWNRLMAGFPPRAVYLQLAVRVDSLEEYRVLRRVMGSVGYRHNVSVLWPDEPWRLVIRNVGETTIQ